MEIDLKLEMIRGGVILACVRRPHEWSLRTLKLFTQHRVMRRDNQAPDAPLGIALNCKYVSIAHLLVVALAGG